MVWRIQIVLLVRGIRGMFNGHNIWDLDYINGLMVRFFEYGVFNFLASNYTTPTAVIIN